MDEADAALDMMFDGGFGAAGAEVVIEEFMQGEEASFFVLCDGEHALPLATAQDHKRVFDGDQGPNTGGMGAYSPAPVMSDAVCAQVMEEIIAPTLQAMAARGTPYKGVLFAGLMITAQGPKLIEYNVRFGDPECQVLMLRLKSDLVPALLAACDGELHHIDLRWSDEPALTVVMAAKGYPGDYAKGTLIEGLDEAAVDRRRRDLSRRHQGRRRPHPRQWRPRAQRHRDRRAPSPKRSAAPIRPSTACAGRTGFCRRDIGWQAIKRETAQG